MSTSATARTTATRAALDVRRIAMLVLSIAGVGVAGYLTWAKLTNTVVMCLGATATGESGCHTVEMSPYSQWVIPPGSPTGLRIPTAAFGVAMYVALIVLILIAMTQLRWRVLAEQTIFAMSFAGVLYSAYLTYLELFVINAICQWCVSSAVIVTLIFVLSIPGVRQPPIDEEDEELEE